MHRDITESVSASHPCASARPRTLAVTHAAGDVLDVDSDVEAHIMPALSSLSFLHWSGMDRSHDG